MISQKDRETDSFGPYIWTYSGKTVHFLDPQPEEITILDIAHHLARIPRFNGVSDYSVGLHTLNVVEYLELSGYKDPVLLRQALFHDAAEAYIGDMPGPIKHTPNLAGYEAIEAALMGMIGLKFNVPLPINKLVKEADQFLVHYEAWRLFKNGQPSWVDPSMAFKVDNLFGPRVLVGQDPSHTKQRFLNKFLELL